jgi:acyl carrier protein
MTHDDIAAKVREIISSATLSIQPDNSNRIVEDLGADSLDTVEILNKIESEFDIKLPDGAAAKIVTVGDAIKCVEEIVNAKE